jgi:hypothetical protein
MLAKCWRRRKRIGKKTREDRLPERVELKPNAKAGDKQNSKVCLSACSIASIQEWSPTNPTSRNATLALYVCPTVPPSKNEEIGHSENDTRSDRHHEQWFGIIGCLSVSLFQKGRTNQRNPSSHACTQRVDLHNRFRFALGVPWCCHAAPRGGYADSRVGC